MIFFMSDPHFLHKEILKYGKRPFKTETECSDRIIKNINFAVQKSDTLIIVGDFCFGNAKHVREFRSRILCDNVILVLGNHDKNVPRTAFTLVVDKIEMTICKKPVIVSHYPFRSSIWHRLIGFVKGYDRLKFMNRRPVREGRWLICGHDHSDVKVKGQQIKVNVEAWHYKPVPLSAIENIINGRVDKTQ
jgi:calcineurin-like phosphoesterase family protein